MKSESVFDTLERRVRRARPRRVVDLLLRPAVQLLEDRSYPGQAPGVMGWALAGTGLAFLDQSLLTFPLDGGEAGRSTVAAWHAESAAGPTGSRPADVAPPLADQVAAWVVSLNAVESPQAGSERQAAGDVRGYPEETVIAAGAGHDDLLPDVLAGPLAQGGLDNLADTPMPRRPFLVPPSRLPAAESGEFTLPSGSVAVSAAPASGNGSGDLGPSPTPLSEADLTALARTLPAGARGNTLPAPSVPSAAMLQTLADNGIAWNGPGSDSGDPPPPTQSQQNIQSRAQSFANTPLRFEANLGQKDARAQFSARANGYSLFLTSTEMVLALDKPGSIPPTIGRQPARSLPHPPDIDVVRMQLVGANANARLTGVGPFPGRTNYLKGRNRSQWVTNAQSFAQVAYHSLYPGIDMLYYGNDKGQLEYDFVVSPGANPGSIQLAFTGTQGLGLDAQGNLILHTAFGDVSEHAPIIYQTVQGVRRPVAGRYLAPDAAHASFQVGDYDHTLPLTIDPFLSYSTYLGGPGASLEGNAIAADPQGDAFVAGGTLYFDLPSGSGVIQAPPEGSYSAFVAAFSPVGQLIFSTYLGGSQDNWANAIALDAGSNNAGPNIYVAGATDSADFPTSPGAFQTTLKGPNAFVTELAPDGRNILYSTFLGGSGFDMAHGIAVDLTSGNVLVTGYTYSHDGPGTVGFPVTANAFQPANNALPRGTFSFNAFVTSLSPHPDAGLVFSTYLGGFHGDSGEAIAVDPAGNAYVTGWTNSNNFPVRNPLQPTNGSGPLFAGSNTASAPTWTLANTGLLDDISALAVYPTGSSSNIIYAGDVDGNIYKKTDQATGWTLLRAGKLAHVTAIVAVPSGDPNNPILFASFLPFPPDSTETFTVAQSLDGGHTWANYGGPPTLGAFVYSLAWDAVNGTLFAGTDRYGVFAYDTTQQRWLAFNDGGFLDEPDVLAVDPVARTLYEGGVVYPYGSVSVFSTTLDSYTPWQATAPMAMDQTNALAWDTTTSPPTLYAGGEGDDLSAAVFTSRNGGTNWTRFSTGLPGSITSIPDEVSSLAIDPTTSPSTIYAGTAYGQVFRTPSTSAAWTPLAGSPDGVTALALTSPGTSSSTLYAGSYIKGNAFVTKFDPSGNPIYSTYLGGNSTLAASELGQGIAVDGSGNAYVTGVTSSANFPTTTTALQPTFGGGVSNAFVTEINAGGSQLVYSTYLGGNRADQGEAIAVNSSGDVYITGRTSSSNFPDFNAYQPANLNPGDSIAFVAKISHVGPALAYSTVLGSNTTVNYDYPPTAGRGIALDALDNAYLTGTAGPDFPLVSPVQGYSGDGLNKVFVTKVTTREIYNNSNPPFGDLGNPEDTGGPSTGVYLSDGEFHDQEVDLQIPGRGLNWQFARSYRSGVQFESPLGRNWDMNYNRRLWLVTAANQADVNLTFGTGVAKPGDVVRIDGWNRADLYVYNSQTQTFTDPSGFFTRLVETDSTHFRERDAHGMVYTYLKPPNSDVAFMATMADPNGDTMQFLHEQIVFNGSVGGGTSTTLSDGNQLTHWLTNEWGGRSVMVRSGKGAGQIRAIVSNTANQLTISPAWDSGNTPDGTSSYSIFIPNQGLLGQVIDTLGRTVNYQYDSFSHLTTVRDFTGRTLRFRVDNNDDLVQVTSPAVIATPNENDFPNGKTVAYGYSSRLGDDRLNHELETIIAPNEFAVGGDGGTPRLTVTYDTDVNSATVARVQTQYVGGTNALNVPAGGLIQYAYYTSDQLPTDANPNAVSQTEVTNRNGNVTAYQFNSQGDIVRTRVLTDATRIPRANQPAFFQTDSTFNVDHELLTRIYPEGNSVANLYDSTNADRYEQGNLLRTTQNPGPRGGDQTTITVSYTYEPIYNQIRTVTDPRGTDPAYRPPIALAGEVYPAPQRYQTVYTYDYQEGTNYAGLAGILGMMPAQVQQLLANANVPMGLGDVNRDNRTDQTAGNLIRVDKPSAHLLPTANQSNISGSVLLRGQAADGNTAQVLNAQNQNWTASQWAGKAVEITGGLGAGQVRTIASNGTNQLALYSTWAVIPDHTSTFIILSVPSQQGGLSTGGSTSTLSDTNQNWVPLQWAGQLLEITGGSQAGQVRTIVSNTATQLAVTPPWSNAPESGSAYKILPSSITQSITLLNTYNSFGLLTKTVDAEGNVNQNAYYPVTSPGSGTAFDDRQGGYLARAFQDTASAAGRDNGTNPMPANVTLGYTYDPMGNVISQTDGRGIETDYSVNQLNQVVQLTKAANVPTQTNTAEPLPLTQYQYLQRNFYDFNNDLVLSQVEDRGNTVNVAGEPFAQELPSFLVYATNQVSRGPNTSTTITTDPQSYTPDALIGKTVQITTDSAGASRGEVRTIVGNSDRMITIDAATPWSPIPSPGAFFAILNIPAPFALVSGGQATGAGASTLSDSKQQWDDLTGRFVEITGGTGAGQVRVITSNTPTQLTLASAWARQPDTTSTYVILALAHDGTAFVDTVYKYDILDQKIETLQEASNGIFSAEFVRTRYRYDPNGHQVLTIYPEGNASASIYDERDLLFQSITGATAPPPQALWIRTYPPDPTNYNVRGGLPATTTFNYDGNRNLIETAAADDTDGSLANNAKAAAGTSTGNNTATTLNDTTQHWITNQWQGQTVLVVSRTGANQVATVVSNTATQLTVTPPWDTTPDNTWVYSFPGKSFSTGGNTDTTLNDTTQQWMPNQWAGRTVRIVAGTGANQVATVAANTPTQLQLTPATAWGITPDETSMYAFQGDRTRFIYDGFDRKTSAIDSLGNQTVNQYDPAGNLVRVTQFGPVGGGSPTSDGPDTPARPVSSAGVIQPANLVNGSRSNLLSAAETSFDELNRPFQTDQVLFVNTTATQRLPDVADGATDLGKGNINPGATQTIPGAIQTLATGQSTGQLNDATHLTDTNQTWTPHQFAGATIKITDGQDMGQVRLIQDNSANQVTISLPWTVVPDASSRYVVQNVVILGRVSTRTEYDRDARATFTVRDDGDTARTDYDGLSRVIKTTDPEGNTLQNAYDANSNVIETSQIDVSQVPGVPSETFLVTSFYDSLNRLQETVDNLGETTDRRYDSLNNLIAVADAQGPANGPTITRRAFPGGSLTRNATNTFGNVTLSYYDGLGRKTRSETILTSTHQGDGTHAGADADGVIRTSGDPTQLTIPTPDPSQGGGDGLIRTGYLWDQNSLQVGMFDDQGNLTVSL